MAADGGSNHTNQSGPARRADGSPLGRVQTEETRKKQAAAKLGRKQSPETIAKRTAALKATWERKNDDKYKS